MPKDPGFFEWLRNTNLRLINYLKNMVDNYMEGTEDDLLNRLKEDPEIEEKLERARKARQEAIDELHEFAKDPEGYEVDM